MRILGCCGGITDSNHTIHKPECPSIIRAALSWIEETPQGNQMRQKALNALDAILASRDSEPNHSA